MYERTPSERAFAQRHGIPLESDLMPRTMEFRHDDDAPNYDTDEAQYDECPDCLGSGEIEEECSECYGSGVIENPDKDHCDTCECPWDIDCEECGGSGELVDTCSTCDGSGEVELEVF